MFVFDLVLLALFKNVKNAFFNEIFLLIAVLSEQTMDKSYLNQKSYN
jgi:hypothetical protein